MLKKLAAAVLIAIMALSFCSCNDIENKGYVSNTSETSTQPQTRIHNNFKDVLPKFRFDSDPIETYREGLSYSFSAECSEKDFNKYVKALKKAGFEVNPAEANGYYAAKTLDKFYVEATLVSGNITVYIKRV